MPGADTCAAAGLGERRWGRSPLLDIEILERKLHECSIEPEAHTMSRSVFDEYRKELEREALVEIVAKLSDRIASLERKLEFIFGDYVLINGRFERIPQGMLIKLK
jgi:hypothetical protein